jgi:hypothetical protein
MLNYQYEHTDYYAWIQTVVDHAQHKYQAQIELTAEENAYVYSQNQNKIQVMGATMPRDKLYILLHEVGHLSRMINNSSDSTFFLDKSGDKNVREKVMTLMEEVLAWHKGEEIARELDIPIEHRAWQRLVNRSVEEYTKWVNEGNNENS